MIDITVIDEFWYRPKHTAEHIFISLLLGVSSPTKTLVTLISKYLLYSLVLNIKKMKSCQTIYLYINLQKMVFQLRKHMETFKT